MNAGRHTPSRSRGIALITALLVIALGTLLSVKAFRAISLDVRRTENLSALEQGYQYAIGLEGWAMAALAEDWRQTGSMDALSEAWAKPLPPIDVEGGQLTGVMIDMDGRFNLNNLFVNGKRQDEQVNILRRLLTRLGLNPQIAEAALDWIDPDAYPSRGGGEDSVYSRFDPPYRAANQPFVHPSELLLLNGVDQESYTLLREYIATLPVGIEPTKVNINTASPELIEALNERITPSIAEQIHQDGGARYETVDALFSQQIFTDMPLQDIRPLIKTHSNFFLAHGTVELRGIVQHYYSLIQRLPTSYQTVYRTRGSY